MKTFILLVITLAVGYANNCTTPTPPSGQIPVLKNCSRTVILFPRGKFEFLNFSWPKSIWIFGILDVIFFWDRPVIRFEPLDWFWLTLKIPQVWNLDTGNCTNVSLQAILDFCAISGFRNSLPVSLVPAEPHHPSYGLWLNLFCAIYLTLWIFNRPLGNLILLLIFKRG